VETEEVTMITLDTIEVGSLPQGCLDEFKAYAAISDESQGMLASSMLTRAMLRVQEQADRSLLPCTFRLEDGEVDGIVRLYQNIDQIVSVKDGNGQAIAWTRAGRTLSVGMVQSVVVEYTTKVEEGNVVDLLPVVYQYAAALYDGQDSRTLASILNQCR
jgi:hypothetical protein